MTQKQITTSKCTILAVKVPEDAKDLKIEHDTWITWRTNSFPHFHDTRLPSRGWQILGIYSKEKSLTEEQWKNFVDSNFYWGNRLVYKNYMQTNFNEYKFETTTESGLSLMQREGIFVVNPLGEKVINPNAEPGGKGSKEFWEDYEKEWSEAESKTGSWLILIQNK